MNCPTSGYHTQLRCPDVAPGRKPTPVPSPGSPARPCPPLLSTTVNFVHGHRLGFGKGHFWWGAIASLVSAAASAGRQAGFQHVLAYYQSRLELSKVQLLIRTSLVVATPFCLTATTALVAFSTQLSGFFFHSDDFAAAVKFFGVYCGLVKATSILRSVPVGLQRFACYCTTCLGGGPFRVARKSVVPLLG
jgi:hypothetical protein